MILQVVANVLLSSPLLQKQKKDSKVVGFLWDFFCSAFLGDEDSTNEARDKPH